MIIEWKDQQSVNSDNYICGMQIYFIYIYIYIYCLPIVIFVCTSCGLGLGVFNPRQIVCYVWLDSHNYNHYVVRLFYLTSGFIA